MRKDIHALFKNPKIAKNHPDQTIYVKDIEQLSSLFSPKRIAAFIELIRYESKPCGVNELADKLHRKQEAISRDMGVLEKHGMVSKTKHGKETHLSALVKSIEIQFASA